MNMGSPGSQPHHGDLELLVINSEVRFTSLSHVADHNGEETSPRTPEISQADSKDTSSRAVRVPRHSAGETLQNEARAGLCTLRAESISSARAELVHKELSWRQECPGLPTVHQLFPADW